MNSTAPTPQNDAQPERTALIVLGMHRSGTSALAGVLGHLGVALPKDLMAASDMNAKGFFESNRITGLNERLLAQAGFTWWDSRRFPAEWFDSPQALSLLDEAVAALTADYGDADLFVIKDPRICRLLPFWRVALARFGAQVRIVHTHRSPWDVAASLARRADYETDYGLLLWTRHVLDAEADSRDLPRSFTSFQALMDDWRATVVGIARDLDMDWPMELDQAAPAIQEFLSADLQHFKTVVTQGPDGLELPPVVGSLYAMAEGWAAGTDPAKDRDRLDDLRATLDASGPLFDALAVRAVRRASEVRHLKEVIIKSNAEHRTELAQEQHQRELVQQDLNKTQKTLNRTAAEAARRDAEIADQARQLVALDRRLHGAQVQLRQLTDQQGRELQGRLRLAVALDDPAAMSGQLTDLADRVEEVMADRDRLRAGAQEMSDHLARLQDDLASRDWYIQREAELLSSTSWRVTAPLRALTRLARRVVRS